ncbi:MORN repeat-containing protein [Toxoplasma gondii ME49]|uniref:MORN repeat-containing protein 5 n=2 Tax=Toxoplasma gondii TaxID=5811 RepID=A0A2G8XYM7_TOXGO|nr:MORN repeat-containing protein [Toxoplasma gondii ME49]EPT31267.1 MORN repeat-containing protein [Toxoplasma gondii ME49]PIM00116.1 MORN repeat-containing protein [Toxoplasma gondii COUG]|eukprot:XP_018637908.1 MORN repeat-containing protein [Toxoplasma gondii ME49]
MEHRNEWTGSSFTGETRNGWFEGNGRYRFANGVVYVGHFRKGDFHGEGELIYPNGGRYKATWIRGKATNGKYIFNDDLEYKVNDWDYITPADRRFYAEKVGGFRPQGIALQTNQGQAESIPYGTYNTGDGFFERTSKRIHTYDGAHVVAEPEAAEVTWIHTKKELPSFVQALPKYLKSIQLISYRRTRTMASRQRVGLFVALCFIAAALHSLKVLGSENAGKPTDSIAAESRCSISSETASTAGVTDEESFLVSRRSSVSETDLSQDDIGPQVKAEVEQEGNASDRPPKGSSRRRDQAFGYGGYYSYGLGFPGFMPYGGYGFLGGFPRMPGFGFIF